MFSFFFIIAIPSSLQDILFIFFKYFFIFFQLRNYQLIVPILAQNSKKEKYLFFILILQLNIFIYFFTFFDFLQYSSFSFKFLLATQCLKLQHFFNSLHNSFNKYTSNNFLVFILFFDNLSK
jgi:hypothetical protein